MPASTLSPLAIRRAAAAKALAAALPLALAWGCAARDAASPRFRDAPLVVVSIDTLRSDRLPVYGYRGVATPAIDRLARDGIVFERAYSHVPLTLPSHLSMFSGLLPGEHGVRDNIGYRFAAERHPWLPRTLRDAGYATGGFVSAYVLRAETGFGSDFSRFDGDIELRHTGGLGGSQRDCRATLALAKRWLGELAERKFFLFVHFYEPHSPYAPAPELRARYADPYDGEIATVDACVEELFAELDRRDLYDESLLFLVSDHGEGLDDHGEREHGVLLYREALQVPFVVKLPGLVDRGTRRADPVALADLAPTALALLGLPPATRSDGLALFPLPASAPPRRLFAETFYGRLHYGLSDLSSVVEGPHHLIHGPDPELYDLDRDPGERDNLRERERRVFATLRDAAREFARPLVAPAAEDAETAAKLAALGYLSGVAESALTGELPDPKSRLGVLRDHALATRALVEQNFPLSAELFEKLVTENPAMVDGWENLGLAYHQLGRLEESLAAYEKAIRLSGGASHVALAFGRLLLDLGRRDEAREHAELALRVSPGAAHRLLAEIALAAKDLETAEREARAALAAGESRAGPAVVLARILLERGRAAEALALTDQALAALAELPAEEQRAPGLHFVRGDLLARLGEVERAEAAFRREIELYPADARPYTRLAALYAALGEPARAARVLRQLVDANPRAPIAWAEAVKTLRVLGDPAAGGRLLAEARRRFPADSTLATL